VMIVPNAHVSTPELADDITLASIGQLLRPILRALRRAFGCDGFNVGFNVGAVAGAGVADHLHQHVVPRWTGDANFMPILASTMVLPELIPVTYAKLRAELAREFSASGEADTTMRLVILDEDATRVAVFGGDARDSLPEISARPDQSFSNAASNFLAEQRMEGVLAGWAGSDRSTPGDHPALTFVATSLDIASNHLRFVEVNDAPALLTDSRDRTTLNQGIRNLAPGIL
jgi:ATP adenylyltransferase